MRNIPPSQAPWTPSQERLDGERLNAIDALRFKLKEAEARQAGLAAEVGANANSIAELSKRIEQLREDTPKMLTGAGGGKRTIRKVLERDGSEWLPDIVEPIVAPLVGPAVNTALSAAIGVTVQGYDPDLAAWALVNPSQFSTSAQIAAAYQPLSTVLTNTTASFTSALLSKLNGIATGATANDTDANLKNRANHTGTQSADTLTDGTTNKAFLATERTKLAGIASGATANDTDANLKARANHTGTQTASTISDFSTAADARISAAVGVSVQGYDAQLADVAAVTPTADQFLGGNGTNLVMRTAAQARTSLGLVIGTNVQAFNANLSAFAGLSLIADRLAYANGTGTLALTNLSSVGRAILDAADTSFTPTLTTDGTNFTSVTYNSARFGRYVKLGPIVFFTLLMRTDAVTVGSASGSVVIGGLPFAAAPSLGVSIVGAQGVSWTTNQPSTAAVFGSSVYIYYLSASNAAASVMTPAMVATGASSNSVRISGFYFT